MPYLTPIYHTTMTQSTTKALITVVAILIIPTLINAQTDTTNTETLWSQVQAFTPTKVMLPDNYDPDKPHTLVIGLHGFGSTAENFMGLGPAFTEAGMIYAVPEAAYPYFRRDGTRGFEWFLYDISVYVMLERDATDLEIAAMRVTTEKQMAVVISDLKEKYNIGEVYVSGFSQGGIIAYLTGIHHHDKVDGIIIYGSVVDEDWMGDDDISKAKDVRTLILQGDQDKAVPPPYAEASRDIMIRNGNDVTYKTFDGGHVVPMHLLGDVVEWIKGER